MSKVLFVTSEVHPLIKTGGLADVSASLPRALLKLDCSVRLLLPAYPSALDDARSTGLKKLCHFTLDGQQVTLWQTRLPGTKVIVWLVDNPMFSARPGNPYCNELGEDWPDNHIRFLLFAKVAKKIALDQAGLKWRPDVVHCSDWQTGLVPALLADEPDRPGILFTIHNLAYGGLFNWDQFVEMQLPHEFWHPDKLEFYQQFSFLKGGLVYADRITTVSPSYAKEIQTPEFGCGLDGLLRSRSHVLSGILNGVNYDEWNPGRDQYLSQTYSRQSLTRKTANKTALQQELGLTVNSEKPLLGFIGRLVEQKGIDLLLATLPQLISEDRCQLAILGSGMKHYQTALSDLADQYPGRISLTLGYSEPMAHRIEAGADIFLMPSLFEPCGLNQMYSLRYGTLPIVHTVGGLRDTIQDDPNKLDEATGFLFDDATPESFLQALERALESYHNPAVWKKLQLNGMRQDFSWDVSAQAYVDIYQKIIAR